MNVTRSNLTVQFADGVEPRIRLTCEGRDPVEHRESDYCGHSSRYRTLHSEAGSFAHRLDIHDLRFLWGRLAPGRYGLQLIYPAGGVREQGATGLEKDLTSPVFAFEVRAASLEEAEKGNPPADAEIVLAVPGKGARIENRSREEVRIHGYMTSENGRDSFGPAISWQAWIPGLGWSTVENSPWHFCGTGKTQWSLRPGASLEIALPPLGDGIYRYTVQATIVSGDSSKPLVARSRTVLVDRFDEHWKKALAEKKR